MLLLEVMKFLALREGHMIQACPWKASYSPGLYMFVSGYVTQLSYEVLIQTTEEERESLLPWIWTWEAVVPAL